MSATDMPALIPAKAITSSASPSRSRASSVEKRSDTIGATGRSASGKRGACGSARHAASSTANSISTGRAARACILVDVLDIDLLARHALRQGGGHEAVEVAVENVTRRGRDHPGAQILDQLVGLEDV